MYRVQHVKVFLARELESFAVPGRTGIKNKKAFVYDLIPKIRAGGSHVYAQKLL